MTAPEPPGVPDGDVVAVPRVQLREWAGLLLNLAAHSMNGVNAVDISREAAARLSWWAGRPSAGTGQAPDAAAPGPDEWGPWFAERMADETFREAFYKADREYDDAHCPCDGTRWVDDKGWEPRWPGDRRELGGRGRLPCGFCNQGGWDVPDPGEARALGTDGSGS